MQYHLLLDGFGVNIRKEKSFDAYLPSLDIPIPMATFSWRESNL